MSRRGYRGSKDGNHDAIVAVFVQLGCTVMDLHESGVKDGPDLAVGCMGRTEVVEVKNPETSYGRAGLQPSQATWAMNWRGSPVYEVRDRTDVVELVQLWRKRKP